MFFGKHESRKKSGGIVGFFRLLISLMMMGILGLGLLLAYKQFSGYDPLALNPKTTIKSLMSSESVVDFITTLLTISPSTPVDKAKQLLNNDDEAGEQGEPAKNQPLLFRFAVVSDSHNDNQNLAKALKMAKAGGAKFVIGTGDYTDVGTMEDLSKAKAEFEGAGLPYYVVPGDHDLWDARNRKLPEDQNFREVFGTPYQAFSYQDVRFILIDNSDNYYGLSDLEIKWLEDELQRLKEKPPKLTLAFLQIPLYHPSSDHVMGKSNAKLKNQADHLISILKRAGVANVIAGDTHFSSKYVEPTQSLKMTNVGAITSARNLQTPRFAVIDVFENGSYNIVDTEIK